MVNKGVYSKSDFRFTFNTLENLLNHTFSITELKKNLPLICLVYSFSWLDPKPKNIKCQNCQYGQTKCHNKGFFNFGLTWIGSYMAGNQSLIKINIFHSLCFSFGHGATINSMLTFLPCSLVPAMLGKVLHSDNVSYTQYPRPSITPQKDSDQPNRCDIKYMGYAIKTSQYR